MTQTFIYKESYQNIDFIICWSDFRTLDISSWQNTYIVFHKESDVQVKNNEFRSLGGQKRIKITSENWLLIV